MLRKHHVWRRRACAKGSWSLLLVNLFRLQPKLKTWWSLVNRKNEGSSPPYLKVTLSFLLNPREREHGAVLALIDNLRYLHYANPSHPQLESPHWRHGRVMQPHGPHHFLRKVFFIAPTLVRVERLENDS